MREKTRCFLGWGKNRIEKLNLLHGVQTILLVLLVC